MKKVPAGTFFYIPTCKPLKIFSDLDEGFCCLTR